MSEKKSAHRNVPDLAIRSLNFLAEPLMIVDFNPSYTSDSYLSLAKRPLHTIRTYVIKIVTLKGAHLIWYTLRNCSKRANSFL